MCGARHECRRSSYSTSSRDSLLPCFFPFTRLKGGARRRRTLWNSHDFACLPARPAESGGTKPRAKKERKKLLISERFEILRGQIQSQCCFDSKQRPQWEPISKTNIGIFAFSDSLPHFSFSPTRGFCADTYSNIRPQLHSGQFLFDLVSTDLVNHLGSLRLKTWTPLLASMKLP